MNKISLFAATAGLLLASFASQATTIKASYAVELNGSGPGLQVSSSAVADNPFTWNLAEGDSKTFDLFSIWTDEETVNWMPTCDGLFDCHWGDDVISKSITVNFDFVLPTTTEVSVVGETDGHIEFYCGGVNVNCQYGSVEWDHASDFYFGNGGQFRISLSNETFNWNSWDGLNSGEQYGATVEATITLIKDSVAVPGPSGIAIFGFGLLSLGVFLRRKREV